MSWSLAERRHDPTTVEGRAFAAVQRLARARAGLDALHAAVETELFEPANPAVILAVRRHAAGTLVEVFNVSDHRQTITTAGLVPHLPDPWHDHLTDTDDHGFGWETRAAALRSLWLTRDIP